MCIYFFRHLRGILGEFRGPQKSEVVNDRTQNIPNPNSSVGLPNRTEPNRTHTNFELAYWARVLFGRSLPGRECLILKEKNM